jgi:hypothetical protein
MAPRIVVVANGRTLVADTAASVRDATERRRAQTQGAFERGALAAAADLMPAEATGRGVLFWVATALAVALVAMSVAGAAAALLRFGQAESRTPDRTPTA